MEGSDVTQSTQTLEDKLKVFYKSKEDLKDAPYSYRLHHPHQYNHHIKMSDFIPILEETYQNFMSKVHYLSHDGTRLKSDGSLARYLNDGNAFYRRYSEDKLPMVTKRLPHIELLLTICLLNAHIFNREDGNESLNDERINDLLKAFTHEKSSFTTKALILDRFEWLQNYDFDYMGLNNEIIDFVNGTKRINIHAVGFVLKMYLKVIPFIELAMEDVDTNDTEDNRKVLLMWTFKISALFDLLYSSMVQSEDSIFYHEHPSDELRDMLNHYEYSYPENIDAHLENQGKGEASVTQGVAIMSRAMENNNIVTQGLSGMKWALAYRNPSKSRTVQAEFFTTVFKDNTIFKMLGAAQSSLAKFAMGRSLPSIAIDSSIQIPISEMDLIHHYKDESNLDDTNVPFMVTESLDLPCRFDKEDLANGEEHKYINMRLNSQFKWNYKVNFKGKNYKPKATEPVHVESIAIYFHGGGFISGSASTSRSQTFGWALQTGYPVFSVDYRLSPESKFPAALNDAWLSYLWIVYYSEKYLNLTFDKVIVMGDSAGGNLAAGVVNLALQKNCKVPDGLILLYPALICSFVHITPSVMISLDDPILNITFLNLALESYTDAHTGLSNHYLLSPVHTPDEILAKFPKTRLLISGIDPFRDDSIDLTRRLVKNGVDTYAVEYQCLLHACINMKTNAFKLEEAGRMMDRTTEFIKELSK